MNELSFLVELLLNHKLPKATKTAVAERLKALTATQMVIPKSSGLTPAMIGQAPSMQAIMARNPDLVAQSISVQEIHRAIENPPPVAVIAQTPATVAAINERNQSIAQAMTGKPEKGRTSPRKF